MRGAWGMVGEGVYGGGAIIGATSRGESVCAGPPVGLQADIPSPPFPQVGCGYF